MLMNWFLNWNRAFKCRVGTDCGWQARFGRLSSASRFCIWAHRRSLEWIVPGFPRKRSCISSGVSRLSRGIRTPLISSWKYTKHCTVWVPSSPCVRISNLVVCLAFLTRHVPVLTIRKISQKRARQNTWNSPGTAVESFLCPRFSPGEGLTLIITALVKKG